jgi:hypothetical protein
MLEIQGHPASLTVAARAGWPGLLTEQELAEPESESLLSYAARTVDEKAGWKRLRCQSPRQGRFKIRVAENGV